MSLSFYITAVSSQETSNLSQVKKKMKSRKVGF